jgi:predicted transcriptional regulator
VARVGELERAVLQVLWDVPDGCTAREITETLDSRELAATTVLTVLDRLGRKGLVTRERHGRAHRYRAAASREEFVADLMLEALDQAGDREAALARFLGAVGEQDTDRLRALLRRRSGPS